ncbi:MerR family transcriptional regulator [Subtercola boreus]|uniref:MerR family transcriptional regulator n=1 Tax=Subtercola boreus TaxID=120213 RepID=A0A3E0VB94_9MICO|nr:MerR family transcriptional regulator [Subtercola boreus]RFA07132.1 MerR family transcriptional regulator [Subtercola boreus]
MAWSTSQIAELAGTTVKAVRHYHEIGLLDLPERTSNGYKQYSVGHLVRLLRITRLTDLEVPLAQIAVMESSDSQPEEALRVLDAQLAETIERLQRISAELKMILRNQSSMDMPSGFSPISVDISEADRALIMIYSRVFGPAEMDDVRSMIIDLRKDPAHTQFDNLAEDAGEETRQSLAEHYAPLLSTITSRYPWMSDPGSRAPRGARYAESTLGEAIHDLYNAAQLDVLRRVSMLRAPEADG